MGVPLTLEGAKDEVVLKCQQHCRDTAGCEQFTMLFPSLCRLSGEGAVPLPAASATMSGPANSTCEEQDYIGHTFLKKASAVPAVASGGSFRTITVSLMVTLVFAGVAGAWGARRRLNGHYSHSRVPVFEQSVGGGSGARAALMRGSYLEAE